MTRIIPLTQPKRVRHAADDPRFQRYSRTPAKALDLRAERRKWVFEGKQCDALEGLRDQMASARRILRASKLRLFRLWKMMGPVKVPANPIVHLRTSTSAPSSTGGAPAASRSS
jgi:hypothetical protein